MIIKKHHILLSIFLFFLLNMFIDRSIAMRSTLKQSIIENGKLKAQKIAPKITGDKRERIEMLNTTQVKKQKINPVDLDELKTRNLEITKLYSYYSQEHNKHAELYKILTRREENKNYYIGVLTTGIFCRFGCTAGPPLAKNTVFSKRPIDLISIGLRECKRCLPLSHGAEGDILKSLQAIEKETYPEKIKIPPPIPESQWTSTKKNIDLVRYVQTKRVMHILSNKHDISFPTKSSIFYQKYWTPIGFMIGCFSDRGLLLLEFMDRRALESELLAIQKKLKRSFKDKKTDLSQQLGNELDDYFQGSRNEFTIPLHWIGSDFQQSVWSALQKIPYGSKNTYMQQAINIGKEDAVRAVANANGANRISILVPCHRVIGTNGKLTGYGGGLDRKDFLLNLEMLNLKNHEYD